MFRKLHSLVKNTHYAMYMGIVFPFILLTCFPAISQYEQTETLPKKEILVPKEELVIRAAIDIGSGATKLRIAEINLKTKKIEKILVNESFSVPYQEELSKSPDQMFTPQVMQAGLDSLKKSLQIAQKYHAEKTIAVATAAFRKAANSEQFIKTIYHETGIPVFIIDQELEGRLAYEAASEKATNPAQMIVWDIGGGSLQLTMKDANGQYQIYRGHDASVPFKNYILQNLQCRSIEVYRTPNPMTQGEIKAATSHAREVATKVDKIFMERIQQPATEVIGVGNVFAYGIPPLMHDQQSFSQKELASAIEHLAGKTDTDMGGGDFANVSVSNAILILGFMQQLNINHVTIVDINNADGALLYDTFWQQK